MTVRHSKSLRANLLYVGTTKGECHLINTDTGEIIKSIKVFHKTKPIQQLLYLRD